MSTMTEASKAKRFASAVKRNDSNLGRLLLEGRAFFALIAIIVVFSLLSPNYFTVSNLLMMASHVAIFGILAIGMLLVILNGGIDLSVGSTLGLAGVVAGFLMQGVTLQRARRDPLSAGLGGGRADAARCGALDRRGQRRAGRAISGCRRSSRRWASCTSRAASRC